MESSLASWQFENFSTAELSPPTSPVPPSSPLFYDGSNPSSPVGSLKGLKTATNPMLPKPGQTAVLGSTLTSRAQTASDMLNELERLHTYEDQNDFCNEESVNLNLFEELADIEYTPPLFSSSENDDAIEKVEVPNPQRMVAVLPSSTDSAIAKLTAEYQSIVESLNSNSNAGNSAAANNSVTSFEDLIQIAGIPSTMVVGNDCLVPVEFVGRPTANLGPEEAESMDLDGIIISNDMTLVNENEIFSLEELSAELIADAEETFGHKATVVNGELPYWAKDMTIPMDELDTEMNKNVDTLEALINGDVSSAKAFISSGDSAAIHPEAFSPVSTVAVVDGDELSGAEEIVEEVKVEKKKSERRGRKPAKNSLNYIRDKALRKKEQNKTAATRYRLKKKYELVTTLSEEDQLQKVHDDLEKEQEKVRSEVRMIRSLLRDMIQARKQRVAVPTPSVSASKLTASSIVQAQRVANRRK